MTITARKDSKEKAITLLTTRTYWEKLKPTVDTITENLWKKYQNRNSSLLINDAFLHNAKTYYRTVFKLSGRCAICASKDKVEMHHERHIRGYNLKQQEGFLAIMGILNRKQIPLCKNHHVCVHKRTYDGISLPELYNTRVAQPGSYIRLT